MPSRKLILFFLAFLLIAACSPVPPIPPTVTVLPTALPPTATATITPIPTPTLVPTAVPGTLYIDPQTSLGEISPYLYGSNHGPFAGIPVDMLEAVYKSGITVLRFPGGAWGDRYDLKPYNIDPFMDFVKKMNATATFSVRLRESPPEKAAELVRYVNIEKKYGIRYWSIGNEPTLFAKELQRTYDTDEFNKNWRAMALAMKAVDPSILLMGPELHGDYTAVEATNPKDSQGKDWMVEFLRANGDLVDIVTIHRYPYPKNQKSATIADLRANVAEWDELIPYLRDLIQRETGRDLPIGITELNSHWNPAVGGEATPDSHYHAVWLAGVLSRIARQGVFMVNYWTLSSKAGQGMWGLIGNNELRPTYYVYQLYKQFGSERVYSSSPNPELCILAAKRQDGALTVILVNLSDSELTSPLAIAGRDLTTAQAFLFDEQHKAEAVGQVDLSAGQVVLPAQSVTLLVFSK